MEEKKMNPVALLDDLLSQRAAGHAVGLPSICSANPVVLEAALLNARQRNAPVLVEATCNQVNQYSGYTGMTSADFVAFMSALAERCQFPRGQLILGGDHLGPSPWRAEPAADAMAKARQLVRESVRAGLCKIHLDASMPLGDDPPGALPAELAAARAAELALAAEQAARESGEPAALRYVIGTEVPAPGGAHAGEHRLQVSDPVEVSRTIALSRQAFAARGLEAAWQRVIAVVVQPGVEFGSDFIHDFQPAEAQSLAALIERYPMVYEAHSTDYQAPGALRALVELGFALLKVGPALTFALREGLFALSAIEEAMFPPAARANLPEILEQVMLENPLHWRQHYQGDAHQQWLARRYSFSDRARYYWQEPRLKTAQTRLMRNLSETAIPLSLLSQHLPAGYRKVRQGLLVNHPQALLQDKIASVLEDYSQACGL